MKNIYLKTKFVKSYFVDIGVFLRIDKKLFRFKNDPAKILFTFKFNNNVENKTL